MASWFDGSGGYAFGHCPDESLHLIERDGEMQGRR
jgi:hypothetical protein